MFKFKPPKGKEIIDFMKLIKKKNRFTKTKVERGSCSRKKLQDEISMKHACWSTVPQKLRSGAKLTAKDRLGERPENAQLKNIQQISTVYFSQSNYNSGQKSWFRSSQAPRVTYYCYSAKRTQNQNVLEIPIFRPIDQYS